MVTWKYVLASAFLLFCIAAFLIVLCTKISLVETKSIYYDAFAPRRVSSGNMHNLDNVTAKTAYFSYKDPIYMKENYMWPSTV